MELKIFIKDNWLTLKPVRESKWLTALMVAILLLGSTLYLQGASWIAASGDSVFVDGEYWRAWTTLFAHGDIAHVLANLFLFIPFCYYLTGYFSLSFFPLAGFLIGGLINFAVLATMPTHVQLVGASGVVYWMGGAWMTLFLLIDRRDTVGKRIIKVLGISAIIFFPETYKPEVSYFSHFLGFITGIASAGLYFYFRRDQFRSAEVVELIYDAPIWNEPYWMEEEKEVPLIEIPEQIP